MKLHFSIALSLVLIVSGINLHAKDGYYIKVIVDDPTITFAKLKMDFPYAGMGKTKDMIVTIDTARVISGMAVFKKPKWKVEGLITLYLEKDDHVYWTNFVFNRGDSCAVVFMQKSNNEKALNNIDLDIIS